MAHGPVKVRQGTQRTSFLFFIYHSDPYESSQESLDLIEISTVPVSLERDLTAKWKRVMILVYATTY